MKNYELLTAAKYKINNCIKDLGMNTVNEIYEDVKPSYFEIPDTILKALIRKVLSESRKN